MAYFSRSWVYALLLEIFRIIHMFLKRTFYRYFIGSNGVCTKTPGNGACTIIIYMFAS